MKVKFDLVYTFNTSIIIKERGFKIFFFMRLKHALNRKAPSTATSQLVLV